MRKDETEVDAGTHGTVQSVGVDGEHPVGLEGEAQGLAYGILHAHVGVDGKEGLLVQHGHALGRPVVLVALEHEERGLHASAERSAYVGDELAMLPKPVGQYARPEELVVAATLGTFPNGSSREIALKARTEVVRKVQLGTSANAECGTADVQAEGIVAAILIAAMYHHAAREALDDLVFLGHHYPTNRQKNTNY